MRTFTTWLLGGVLAASLSWNWKLVRESDTTACAAGTSAGASRCAAGARCETEERCDVVAGMDFDPKLRADLQELCARSCGESDRLERRANELQSRLLADLSAAQVDEAALAHMVDEVSELRRRSLLSCVKGILGVREVLSEDQVRELLARCAHAAVNER